MRSFFRVATSFAVLSFLVILPLKAFAHLVTFQMTGLTDEIELTDTFARYPVTVDLTVDTDAIGTQFSLPAPSLGGETYDITEPGTGLSVALDGETVFAQSLRVNVIAGEETTICNPKVAVPLCDIFVIQSDLARLQFVSSDASFGAGLAAPTLSALAQAPLQDYHGSGLDPDLILELPGYEHGQIFANLDEITVSASEPSTLPLTGIAAFGVIFFSAGLRRRVRDSVRPPLCGYV